MSPTNEPPPADRSIRSFAIVTVLAAIPLLIGFWFGGHILTQLLSPLVELAGRSIGVVDTLEPADGGWRVVTGDMAIGSDGRGGVLTLQLAETELLRLALSIPFFLALMAAPPRASRWLLKVLIGVTAMTCVCVFSAAWVLLAKHMVEVNQLDWGAGLRHSGVLVDAARYPDWMAYPVELGDYVTMAILPLAAPVVAWLVLNLEARAMVTGVLRRRSATISD
ncbi:exosortase H-associated membrane protein [Brevundimonas sp.]|uniref:exosortase H-associated membrane protein n=1 Tax=Brevundimonas sp. TaxID=1871086 RepID=UPI0035B24FE1